MTSEQFVYWLQGFLEIQNPKEINETQLKIIQDHINLVFRKETPFYYTPLYSGETPNKNKDIFIHQEQIFPNLVNDPNPLALVEYHGKYVSC